MQKLVLDADAGAGPDVLEAEVLDGHAANQEQQHSEQGAGNQRGQAGPLDIGLTRVRGRGEVGNEGRHGFGRFTSRLVVARHGAHMGNFDR